MFQACRGKCLDGGVDMSVLEGDETDAGRRPSYEVRPSPLYKDGLIMYATPPGRNNKNVKRVYIYQPDHNNDKPILI